MSARQPGCLEKGDPVFYLDRINPAMRGAGMDFQDVFQNSGCEPDCCKKGG